MQQTPPPPPPVPIFCRLETELHRALKTPGTGALLSAHRKILQSLTMVGTEMLCRWHHPERGVLLPQEVYPGGRRNSADCGYRPGFVREGLRPAASVAAAATV